MENSRLTMEKPTHEMSMTELALNSVYIDADKNVRYRDYDQDVDARELAASLLRNMSELPEGLEPSNGTDFDLYMAELLSDPIDSPDGLIALFYRNLWAMAELRQRLMEYEDTGLTPEDAKAMYDTVSEVGAPLWKIKELYEAESDGLLLKLPCKVGDTVYRVWNVEGRRPEITAHKMQDVTMIVMWLDKFGKDVFLSRAEANASLIGK